MAVVENEGNMSMLEYNRVSGSRWSIIREDYPLVTLTHLKSTKELVGYERRRPTQMRVTKTSPKRYTTVSSGYLPNIDEQHPTSPWFFSPIYEKLG